MIRTILVRLRNFFWPSPRAPLLARLAPYVFLLTAGVIALVVTYGGWTYTNSNTFCGTTCHTMPPQYQTYLKSPHSRVDCVECHLGREVLTTQIPRKVEHSSTLYALLFNTYHFPIVAQKMRPANEACETCHFPRKFSEDNLKEVRTHLSDEANSLQSIFLVMKVGGGTRRSGEGRGIHWHIENKITFLATDPLQQDIPYVRAVDGNGNIQEFLRIGSPESLRSTPAEKMQNMDCITCHNRDSHEISTPEQAVDEAMFNDSLPANLPFLRQKAIELLSIHYASDTAARQAFSSLDAFYQQKYPDVYNSRRDAIRKASAILENIYHQIYFPNQKLDWTSHPDNLGHKDSPGCFRCHDGQHVTPEGEGIRLECNLCHSIPMPTDPSQYVTDIRILRSAQPPSHTSTHWVAIHGKAIDTTCARCHPPTVATTDFTKLAGKKPPADGSFCGNSACHNATWQYTGFNSPALEPILKQEIKKLPPLEKK